MLQRYARLTVDLDLALDLAADQATPPIPCEELHERASTVVLAGVPVRVASRRHLIALKRRAGRARDLDDVAALQALDGD